MIKLNKPKTLPWQYEALTVKGQSLFLIKSLWVHFCINKWQKGAEQWKHYGLCLDLLWQQQLYLQRKNLSSKTKIGGKNVWTYNDIDCKSRSRNVCKRCRNGYYTSLHRNKAEEKKMIEIFLLYHNHKVHYDIITHREFCKAKFEGNINSYNKHSQTL